MKLFFTPLLLITTINFAAAQTNCDSWVNLQNRFAAITVGDLDVTGNKITVEASFNMTGPSVNIVSKHFGGGDVNYLLRPVRAEITTDISGFVVTTQGASPCNDVLELNKTYHAALVYDGSTLKFYRNGALISQVPASGNLITNNWNTGIGEHAPVVTPLLNGNPSPYYHNQNEGEGFYDESFRGFINEVRIWNVARTQDQIKTYMNAPLPDPTTQVGLMGYWVLNDLQNRQGNATYNGTIEGLAAIGQTNTSCTFIADSCNVVLPVKLTDFNAAVFEKKSVKLNWQTEGETGIISYTIERSESSDFKLFASIGTVNSSGGSTANNYSFTDNTLLNNKLYFYRLKINEVSGSAFYSVIKSGKISGRSYSADIYPNPIQEGIVNIRFNDVAGKSTITVLNSIGQVLITKNVSASPGTVVTIDLKKYSKGNFFINILTENNKIVKKIIQL